MPDRTQNPMRPVGNRLRNGVLGGDPDAAPRCGARTRGGAPCRGPAVRGKRRCRMHGGASTGPRTAEGLERLRAARTRHGGRGRETRELLRWMEALLVAAVAPGAPQGAARGRGKGPMTVRSEVPPRRDGHRQAAADA